MKILFLTTQLPYPPVSGGVIKTWNLVRHWSDQDLMLICALKAGDRENLEAFKQKLPGINVFAIPFEKKRSPINLLKSYLFAPTLNVYRNRHPEIAHKVEEWIPKADVVFVDHYEMGQYVSEHTDAPIVLHEHNAEFVMWERLAEIETNPIKKFLIKAEANRIKRTELHYASMAETVLAAPNDIRELASIGVPKEKMHITYHLGEDHMLELPPLDFEKTEKALLFIGTLTWEANIDGLLWFLQEVFPLVMKSEPDVRFYIVGKNPDPRIKEVANQNPNITLPGFVEDTEPFYARSRVFAIPLRFGSGIKVKLLNAMYRGIPTVTTPIGTEGLDVESGKELYSEKDPESQARNILTLLRDQNTWEKMRDASRMKVKKYTWATLLSDHDEVLRSLVNAKEQTLMQKE